MQTKREKFKLYLLGNLFAIKKGEKKALKHFKHVIKICPNRGHIFQNKLQNTWAVSLKTSAVSQLQLRLVCRAKDKNKTNT